MKRITSIKEVADIMIELPAGADPYEEYDFQPYFEEHKSEEELRKTWRVFTRVKDVIADGRRMENASWRLWFRERLRAGGVAPTPEEADAHASELEKTNLSLDASLRSAEQTTAQMAGEMFSGGMDAKFAKESEELRVRAKAERTRALLALADKHSLPENVLNDFIRWVHASILDPVAAAGSSVAAMSDDDNAAVIVPGTQQAKPDPLQVLPTSHADARAFLDAAIVRPRPRVAAFSHSLERNGANNFLLYLLRELRHELAFVLYSAKEGAMRADYEALSIPVHVINAKAPSYPSDVRNVLSSFEYAIANTIMTPEIINASKELNVPCLWVIHEAWPQDQFNYYAKEVFMMTHLDDDAIRSAFANASKIVFPAHVQEKCYDGLAKKENTRVIYNGIPLASINAFRMVQNRDKIRADLGYTPDDILLVHMGTVCKRKGQVVTCRAFSQLMRDVDPGEGKSFKLLMVGARYIRDHEIKYIDECKSVLAETGALESTVIEDVKKNVLPYYLSADIILCPSLNEVLPLVICEGMAFERPIIASRIDGIPEALSDGVEGLLIPPNSPDDLFEAVKTLALDQELRERMGKAGRKRVLDQFSFSTMSKHYRKTIAVDIAEM